MMTFAIMGLMTVGYDRTQTVLKSAMSILTLGLLGFFINGIWGWV